MLWFHSLFLRHKFPLNSMDNSRSIWAVSAIAAIVAVTYILWGPNHTRRRKYRISGLLNLGNTCFVNAVLQALASCPGVLHWLEATVTIGKEPTVETCKTVEPNKQLKNEEFDENLTRVLYKTLTGLNRPDDSCNSAVQSASDVLTALRRRHWVISSDQQDVHEMFHCLTSTLEEEIRSDSNVLSLASIHKLDSLLLKKSSVGLSRINSWLSPMDPRTDMKLPFRGLLTSQLRCKRCGYKCPVKVETFDSISVPLPTVSWGSLTLLGCLRQFVMSEHVQDVDCEGCTVKQSHHKLSVSTVESTENILNKAKAAFVKRLTFGKLPDTLCIHIQRTVWLESGMLIKRHDHVQFTEYLNMDEFVYNGSENNFGNFKNFGKLNGGSKYQDIKNDSKNVDLAAMSSLHSPKIQLASNGDPLNPSENLYVLKSVIVHLGDVFSGHYITYRRGPPNTSHHDWKWYSCSDSVISDSSIEEVLQCDAYLLFYERNR